MATPLQIADLRPMIGDESVPYEFDDTTLGVYIDVAGGDLRKAAGQVWTTKSARLAGLVDVTEGSSSRKMSQLHSQALKMVEFYGAAPEEGVVSGGVTRTRKIVRE